jgi:valyl-tRNA synthetase
MNTYRGLFTQLARLESVSWIDADAESSQCAVALAGDLKILVPLKGLVDIEAELARLNRQLEAEKANLAKAEAKLENRRFVDNAPAAVVAQEQERRATHLANVTKLREQYEQLESLRD